MKWGDKSVNGCKSVPCDKLHPLLCPRSLDLKCFEKTCDVKLHTRKCKRARPTISDPAKTGNRAVKKAPIGTAPKPAASQTGPKEGVPSQSQPSAVHHHQQGGTPVQVPSQWYQPGVYQPLAGMPGGVSNQWLPPPGPQHVQPPLPGGYQGGVHWGGVHPGQSPPPGITPLQVGQVPQPPGTWSAFGQPTVPWTPVQYPGVLPAAAVGHVPGSAPQTASVSSMQPPSFQLGCAVTSPAAHQLLDVWAANMAKEMARQTEITRAMLVSSVKEMSQHLGGQGILRPHF